MIIPSLVETLPFGRLVFKHAHVVVWFGKILSVLEIKLF